MRPDKIKGPVAAGLNMAGGHTVDLLLNDEAGENRGHHRRGAAPPSFGDDVE